MNYLLIHQQIYQAKQKAQSLFTKYKVYPLTIDATPLNYNSFFPERAGNNSLNSCFIDQDNLNGTRNLIQQDIQTPSHFLNEEIVEIITTTEVQQSISPIQPNFTTSKKKNVTTNNYTIHDKTICSSKIFTNGLPNVSNSNTTIIKTKKHQKETVS